MTQRTLIATLTALTAEQILAETELIHYPFQLEWRIGQASLEARSGYILIDTFGDASYPNIRGRFVIPPYLVKQYAHLRFGISADFQVLKVYRVDDTEDRNLRIAGRGTHNRQDELDGHRDAHDRQHENIKFLAFHSRVYEGLMKTIFGAGTFGTEVFFRIADRVFDPICDLYFSFVDEVDDETGATRRHYFRRQGGVKGFFSNWIKAVQYIYSQSDLHESLPALDIDHTNTISQEQEDAFVTAALDHLVASIKAADLSRQSFNPNIITYVNADPKQFAMPVHNGLHVEEIVLTLGVPVSNLYMPPVFGLRDGVTVDYFHVPEGLTVNAITGKVSGTPTNLRSATFSMRASIAGQVGGAVRILAARILEPDGDTVAGASYAEVTDESIIEMNEAAEAELLT